MSCLIRMVVFLLASTARGERLAGRRGGYPRPRRALAAGVSWCDRGSHPGAAARIAARSEPGSDF